MKPDADGRINLHFTGDFHAVTSAHNLLAAMIDNHVHWGNELTLDRRHEGAPGLAHGGALATALDDLLGTVLIIIERPAVTASLTIDYRRPALLHRRYDLEAWCERIEGRKLYLAGTIKDGDALVAEARALFLQVDLGHFERSGQPLPAAWEAWGR